MPADRETTAERLGERHDVRLDAGTLIGEQLAGAAHAALHLVEDQQHAVLVAQRAQAFQKLVRRHAHAALALDRLDQDRGGVRTDRLLHRLEIAERHLVEAVDHRAEAFEVFLLSAGRERRERAAMEGALEGDDAVAVGLAVHGVELARGLDRAFHRLGARIGEEHVIREALLAQAVGELLLLGHAEQVGDMDRLVRLRGDRGGDLRVRVTERVDGNAGGKIEIALAIGGGEPGALAVIEREINSREGRQKVRGAHEISRCCWPGTIETYPPLPIARSG